MSDAFWKLSPNEGRHRDPTLPPGPPLSSELRTQIVNDPLLSLELVHVARSIEAQKNGGECQTCFTFVSALDAVRCEMGHVICRSCVRREIEVFLVQGKTEFGYPFIRCTSLIPSGNLVGKIPPKLLQRVIEAEAAHTVAELKIDGIVKCSHCGAPFEFEGFGSMTCTMCGFTTCSRCEGPWHEGPCQRLSAEHKAEEEATAQLVSTCSRCKADIMREGGCNLMKCPTCGTMACYFCGQIIPADVKYDHFWARPGEVCPPTACPLCPENVEEIRTKKASRIMAEQRMNA
jgi:hypothetical protein